MRSPLFRSLILLAVSTAAQSPSSDTRSAWPEGAAIDDWVPSGNYLIYSCGSRAPIVKSILDSSWLYIQNALLSTETPQYKAFFKSADPSFVKTILTSMTLGTNFTVSEHASIQPTFICVNEEDPSLKEMWQVCLNHPQALTASSTDPPVMFLCPNFFRAPAVPVLDNCPRVNRAGTGFSQFQRGAGIGLNFNQYKFMVQVLAKMYIREALGFGKHTPLKDTIGEGPCVLLSEHDSVRNPSSYAYFAASVRAGCTEFPTKLPTQHRRILSVVNETSATLEGVGEDNQTSAVTLDCASKGTDSAPCPS